MLMTHLSHMEGAGWGCKCSSMPMTELCHMEGDVVELSDWSTYIHFRTTALIIVLGFYFLSSQAQNSDKSEVIMCNFLLCPRLL